MSDYENKLSITAWAEADRPREKLMLQGRRQLTDAELIAILIGSGNRDETAVDLSKRILKTYQNNLDKLAAVSIKDLSTFKGIGEAKAITIVAALELGRRRKETEKAEPAKIVSSKDAFQLIAADLEDLPHEEFWLILLNHSCKFIAKHFLSKGGHAATIVDPKFVFKAALEHNASALILVHNHPSGNLKPSEADLRLTKRLVELGKMMDIRICDHLIIANNKFLSLADESLM
jgi:DNA repair protein RadC